MPLARGYYLRNLPIDVRDKTNEITRKLAHSDPTLSGGR